MAKDRKHKNNITHQKPVKDDKAEQPPTNTKQTIKGKEAAREILEPLKNFATYTRKQLDKIIEGQETIKGIYDNTPKTARGRKIRNIIGVSLLMANAIAGYVIIDKLGYGFTNFGASKYESTIGRLEEKTIKQAISISKLTTKKDTLTGRIEQLEKHTQTVKEDNPQYKEIKQGEIRESVSKTQEYPKEIQDIISNWTGKTKEEIYKEYESKQRKLTRILQTYAPEVEDSHKFFEEGNNYHTSLTTKLRELLPITP